MAYADMVTAGTRRPEFSPAMQREREAEAGRGPA